MKACKHFARRWETSGSINSESRDLSFSTLLLPMAGCRRRHGGNLLPLLLLPLLLLPLLVLVLLLLGCFASMCVTMTKLRGLTQPKAASPKFRTLTCKHQTASPKPSPAPPNLKLVAARAWKPPSPNPSIIEAPAISNGIPYISLLLLRHKFPLNPILSIKAFILNAYCSRHSLALYCYIVSCWLRLDSSSEGVECAWPPLTTRRWESLSLFESSRFRGVWGLRV